MIAAGFPEPWLNSDPWFLIPDFAPVLVRDKESGKLREQLSGGQVSIAKKSQAQSPLTFAGAVAALTELELAGAAGCVRELAGFGV